MKSFTLSVTTLGVPFYASAFDAHDEAHALFYGRGYVDALCELRPDFEIGARYRLDRVMLRRKKQIMDNTTFVAECEVVERDGEVETIWCLPAPPPKAERQ